jgi:hypothetical protein
MRTPPTIDARCLARLSGYVCISQSVPINAYLCWEKRLTIGENRNIVPYIPGKNSLASFRFTSGERATATK